MHLEKFALRCSEHLGSEAIVEYVKALVLIAEEELQPVNHPRVFSLTKIVEISDFNMGRIRQAGIVNNFLASTVKNMLQSFCPYFTLQAFHSHYLICTFFSTQSCRLVWNRIWAVLSDFFIQVGCHKNLQVAMFAVDSLRQLAMKFLERDELANYSFQTLFMAPLVVVMRQSKAVEIRELIIR